MLQGWHDDDYLILFNGDGEAEAMTACYESAKFLPHYTILGLTNWDDFIILGADGHRFTVPTVPLDLAYVRPHKFNFDPSRITPDTRYVDKIKWYVQPLVLGGDPRADGNTAWITLEQHIDSVKWWNSKYRELKQGQKK